MEIDLSSGTLNKKIRNAQVEQFNYIVVVGEKEEKTRSVNLRDREKKEPLVKKTSLKIQNLIYYILILG